MSDRAQGPGWWVASDGNWYPPELHPSVTAPPPPPPSRPAQPQPSPEAAYPSSPAPAPTSADISFGAPQPRVLRLVPALFAFGGMLLVVVVAVTYYLTAGSGNSSPGASGTSGSEPRTVPVAGTILSVAVTRLLDPAPAAASNGSLSPGNVLVAVYVSVTNVGTRPYALDNLAFGVVQGDGGSGGIGYATTAGAALPQHGILRAGATVTGWVTSVAGAGAVTGISVAFNARTATSPGTTVSDVFPVG